MDKMAPAPPTAISAAGVSDENLPSRHQRSPIAVRMIPTACLAFYVAAGLLADVSPADEPCAHAVEVRRFSFESDEDRDYDQQPDDWSRRRGPGFPQYVKVEIDRRVGYHGRQSLRCELNGAAFAYYSPLVKVDDQNSYFLRGKIRAEGLHHDAAIISVSLLDHTRRRVQRLLTRPVMGNSPQWLGVEIGPFRPSADVHFLVIGCHIVQGDQTDVRGNVWFDDLWLGQMPLLELSTASGLHLFEAGSEVAIRSRVAGLPPDTPHQLTLKLEAETGDPQSTTCDLVAGEAGPGKDDKEKSDVSRIWTLPRLANGFYRVHARLERGTICILEQSTTFVIMDLERESLPGEFGWSLSSGPGKLTLAELAEIAGRSGVNWLKLPMWSGRYDELSADLNTSEMAIFLDRLEQQRISAVGLLSDPPLALTEKFARQWDGVSSIFNLPRDLWYPSLEPIIARHSFRIRHWQLGNEADDSFIGLQSLPATLAAVKKEFDRIGHNSRMGVHWTWREALPERIDPSSFLSLADKNRLDPETLLEHLERSAAAPCGRWVLIEPLPSDGHEPVERATDLARQMLAARLGKAEAIFAANPLDPRVGLLHEDGSPTPLYLPWRTVALALRGATYLGRWELPNQSANAVFARGGEVIAVVWNSVPMQEEFFFGDEAVAIDLWGRRQPLPVDARNGTQTISAGPTPLLIRGCSEPVARWRLAVQFEKGRIRSEYGAHEDAILGLNTFPQGVNGQATLRFPPGWQLEPADWPLQMGAGEKFRLPTQITFPPDASLGKLRPSIEFKISADRQYRFSIQLPYQLGLGDVDLQVTSRRTPEGRLEIEQRIINKTDPPETLDFNCSLFIPGQVRQRQVVTRLGQGEDKRVYILPNADQLRGRDLWLRAEQIDGPRVLNYHWKVDAAE